MGFDTAGTIVNDAAVELGLLPFASKLTDPFGSTDQNIGLLCQLLKPVGKGLLRLHQWSNLDFIHTFNTAVNVANYSLPTDYGRFIDQSAWNRTNRLPVGGPLSPQQFEYFKARLVGVVFTVLFRTVQGNFQVYPDTSTPGGYVIAFEYMSSFWVLPAATHATTGSWNNGTPYTAGAYVTNAGNIYTTAAGGTSGTYGPVGTVGTISDGAVNWTWVSVSGADAPSLSTDVLQLESNLLSRALILQFRKNKGLDTTAAMEDVELALEQAKNADSAAPVLSLGGASINDPLIGEKNLPVTGYGV